ncbi:LpqB family beta-propeller domain-containing protein [Dactylosporangium sp. CA-092794]|uniref:LpqB family beta-propeller domain-containing protein n=1 Tax=Dactylosporangium sp. CA-092794 TaxID=3239929 RepID=UPI003D8E52C9
MTRPDRLPRGSTLPHPRRTAPPPPAADTAPPPLAADTAPQSLAADSVSPCADRAAPPPPAANSTPPSVGGAAPRSLAANCAPPCADGAAPLSLAANRTPPRVGRAGPPGPGSGKPAGLRRATSGMVPADLRPALWRRGRRPGRGAVAGVVAALGALLLLGACALPSHTDPKYAGPAQSAAAAPGGVTPPKPSDADSPQALVDLFLKSSVGANLGTEGAAPDAGNETLDRMRQFMTDAMRKRWVPGKDLTIVRDPVIYPRLVGSGRYEADVTLHPIGQLTANGEVIHPVLDDIPVNIQVATIDTQLRLDSFEPKDPKDAQLLLSESGLRALYDQRPVYFWESGLDDPRLVPDLRYMPRTLSPAKQVSEVLRWLKVGPTQWLRSVADIWPQEFDVKDNPVIEDSDVKVNLSGKAASRSPDDLNRLARQIRWSLPGHPLVRLMIENQHNDADSTSYEPYNVAGDLASASQDKFVVSAGAARTVAIPPAGEQPLFVPSPNNQNVVSAAINRQLNRAALVRQTGTGTKIEQRLFVSSPDLPIANPPVYLDTGVVGQHLSRPEWINYPVQRLLISDGSKLYVSSDDKSVKLESLIPVANLPAGPITAFAVAPDGHRIALIVGGTLLVATLQLDNGKLSIGGLPQQITTSLGSTQAVGWLTETTLVVGGKPSPAPPTGVFAYSLVAITVDGAIEEVLPTGERAAPSQLDVTSLAVRTNPPSATVPSYTIMIESNGVAQNVYHDDIGPVKLSPPPAPGAAEPLPPTAPFFSD